MTEIRSAMVANQVAVNDSIIDNSDIWAKGNRGEVLNEAEQVVFNRVVRNVNDFYYHAQRTWMVVEPESRGSIHTDFAGFLFEHPEAYKVWIERERRIQRYRITIDPADEIGSAWVSDVESKLALLRQGAASPD